MPPKSPEITMQEPVLHNPAEFNAIADRYQEVAERSTFDTLRDYGRTAVASAARIRKTVAAGLAVAASAGAMASTAEAADTTFAFTNTETTSTTIINGSKVSDEALAKVRIGAYSRANGLSKKQQRKIVRDGGKCYSRPIGSRFTNSLRKANGKLFFYRDTVKAGQNRFCRTESGKEIKVNCGNPSFTGHTPKKTHLYKGRVIAIRSWNKGSAKVEARSNSTAEASCQTNGGFAKAYGNGQGYAYGRISFRNIVSAKGRNIRTEVRGEAEAEAMAKSSASANTQCSKNTSSTSTVTATTTEQQPAPGKDGTQGPGTGTTGEAGGPGAGGSPAPATETGEVCRDDSGNVVSGPSDQYGYCA